MSMEAGKILRHYLVDTLKIISIILPVNRVLHIYISFPSYLNIDQTFVKLLNIGLKPIQFIMKVMPCDMELKLEIGQILQFGLSLEIAIITIFLDMEKQGMLR